MIFIISRILLESSSHISNDLFFISCMILALNISNWLLKYRPTQLAKLALIITYALQWFWCNKIPVFLIIKWNCTMWDSFRYISIKLNLFIVTYVDILPFAKFDSWFHISINIFFFQQKYFIHLPQINGILSICLPLRGL